MNRGATIFARGVVYFVGLAALSVCGILLPEIAREEQVGKPENLLLTSTFLGGAYILALPFFIALYQTLQLLKRIDAKKAFTPESIKILTSIKYCTIIFSGLILIAVITGASITRSISPQEDITFMLTFGFLGVAVSSIITVFVALLQKLLTEAVEFKLENDLIV